MVLVVFVVVLCIGLAAHLLMLVVAPLNFLKFVLSSPSSAADKRFGKLAYQRFVEFGTLAAARIAFAA